MGPRTQNCSLEPHLVAIGTPESIVYPPLVPKKMPEAKLCNPLATKLAPEPSKRRAKRSQRHIPATGHYTCRVGWPIGTAVLNWIVSSSVCSHILFGRESTQAAWCLHLVIPRPCPQECFLYVPPIRWLLHYFGVSRLVGVITSLWLLA